MMPIRSLWIASVFATVLAACAPTQQAKDASSIDGQKQLEEGYAAYRSGEYNEAYKLLRPLAESGNPDAQTQLGNIYRHGNSVPRDLGEALKWYQLAAAKGNAVAQLQIGSMHEIGQIFAQDYSEAAKWYKLAAAQGLANAQQSLGLLYEKGAGVKQDDNEAARLFRLVAEKGFCYGQLSLGRMYAHGRGVPYDPVQSYMWLSLASREGHPAYNAIRAWAMTDRALLEPNMTSAQLSEAQRLADVWKPTIPCKGIECFALK